MTEKVKVWQNNQFQLRVEAVDPQEPEGEFHPVDRIHQLNPYSMMLLSLGSCTTIVMHTYAQNHGIDLQEVEIQLVYRRIFQEDCENCEEIERYEEHIEEEISISGDLSEGEKDRLFHVAHQCPIEKMFEEGIEIESSHLD